MGKKKKSKKKKLEIVKNPHKVDYKELFTRSKDSVLSEDLILDLYEVLRIHESKTELGEIEGIENIKYSHNKLSLHKSYYTKVNKQANNKTKKVTIISPNFDFVEQDFNLFYIEQGTLSKSLIAHFRNAFAHNNIIKQDEKYILGDFLPNKSNVQYSQPTMLACLTEIELKQLISSMKKCVKTNTNNKSNEND